jgi:hypothetical protein
VSKTELRPARMGDVWAIVDIVVERHKDTRYASSTLDTVLARKIIAGAIHRQGGRHEGGAFVMVAERDGAVVAFVQGSIVRPYGFINALVATDDFLLGRRDCHPRTLDRLFAAYVTWAESVPGIIEIGAAHNDVIAGSDRFGPIYRKEGMRETGRMFVKELAQRAQEREIAA